MSLLQRATGLAEQTGQLGGRTAGCFAAARCAGADVKALRQCYAAAGTLGAPAHALAADTAPWPDDAAYLAEVADLRVAAHRLLVAIRALQFEALGVLGDDEASQAAVDDARRALTILEEPALALPQAQRLLAWAGVEYAQVYEAPVALVAAGGVLPHDGRWITGEQHERTAR